jgi:ABC-type oligopeptide transport system ATPase subunit
MKTQKSEPVKRAELSAKGGDPLAMEFLARRFFEGRGAIQSYQKSYYWSTIALNEGIDYLNSLNQFALKKLSEEERVSTEKHLQVWFEDTPKALPMSDNRKIHSTIIVSKGSDLSRVSPVTDIPEILSSAIVIKDHNL